MSSYFTHFPLVNYDLFFDKQTSQVTDLFRVVKVKKEFRDDITFYTYYDIQDGERPDVVSSKLYGTPDYYWTFFMINDNLVNLHTDWPLSNPDLQHLLEKKYPGYVLLTNEDISTKFSKGTTLQGLISGARATLIDKDSTDGILRIDNITGTFVANEIVRDLLTNEFVIITNQVLFSDAPHHFEASEPNVYVNKGSLGARPITFAEYEYALNDKKSKIKIIRPGYVQNVANQFIEEIKSA